MALPLPTLSNKSEQRDVTKTKRLSSLSVCLAEVETWHSTSTRSKKKIAKCNFNVSKSLNFAAFFIFLYQVDLSNTNVRLRTERCGKMAKSGKTIITDV